MSNLSRFFIFFIFFRPTPCTAIMSVLFFWTRLIFFFLFLNAGAHGLVLEVVNNCWLVAKCRGAEVFRWLGPNNVPHGINKLQSLKAFKANKKERQALFGKICASPKFQNFFTKYETLETYPGRHLFQADFELFDELLTRDPTTNFVTQLKKFL